MSGVSFAHRAEAWLVRGCLGLFRLLPITVASKLGGGVARAIGPLIPVSKIADKNLRMAMPELDAAQRRAVIKDVWENLGCTVGELARLGELHETESGPGFRMTGWDEHVAPALAKGGPAIFFTGHIANWEILPPAAFAHGADIGFMYRAASNPLVNDLILRLREANFKRKVTMFPERRARRAAGLCAFDAWRVSRAAGGPETRYRHFRAVLRAACDDGGCDGEFRAEIQMPGHSRAMRCASARHGCM